MLENATNLTDITNITNATNLTTQLEEESAGYIINGLKAFFLEPWVGNLLLFILILATIGVAIMSTILNIKGSFYKRLTQECDVLFQLGKVKLDYDKKGLKYTHPSHQYWDLFKIEVEKQIGHRRYKARKLCKKVKRAFNDYIDCDNKLFKKVKTSLNDVFARKGWDFIWVDDKEGKSLENIVKSEGIYNCILKGSPSFEERPGKDGGYVLLCNGIKIAKTDKPKMREELKDLIELISNDSGIKGYIKKHGKAESDFEQLLEEYNKKIAKAIQDLKLLRWGRWWLK